MAAHWDRRNTRPLLPSHNSYHGQTTAFQPPLPEHLGHAKPPSTPFSEHRGRATPFAPSLLENSIVPVPYYEGYTIRPDDLASSEERWSLPPKRSIPATQEDLHTEVIRQRQSGRTACRELEDCHGPKRQYIDRLIRERDATTSLGHFEVAQLRLERIPRDSGKASNRNSGRNYHARDYKQKDFSKPRQKTVYMHIILQFMKYPDRVLAQIPQENFAPRNANAGNGYRSWGQHTSREDIVIPLMSSNDQPSVLSRTSQQPTLPSGYTYTTADEQVISPPSSRYISRGTQTPFSVDTRPGDDWSSADITDDVTLGGAPAENSWITTTNVEEEMLRNSPSSDDEIVSVGDSAAAHELTNESTEKKSSGIDEYEKPPWFQNLQPVKSPGITHEQTDVFYQQDDGEASTTHEEKDPNDAYEKDDEEVFKAHGEEDSEVAQPNILSWSREESDQRPPDHAANHTEHDDDYFPDYTENESAPIATELQKLESIDEHPITGPTNIPMSGYLSNLLGPPPPEKLPPSERYKPRPPLNPLPARPSLTRASAAYDSRSTDDSERKSSKRVSFQQASTPLYTPPSTSTSSPVSPSASPQMPVRTIPTKPPPVSIPPGQYTPVASSSPPGSYVSPSSPPALRKPYTCLDPTCDSSFDHPYDRDRHERQHGIGNPEYSVCPICRHSRSGSAAVDGGLRELLIAHMNRRHWEEMESAKRKDYDEVARTSA